MNSQEKQGYIDEINYQKKMIHNLIKWLRNLFFLSSLGVLLMYYFSNILFVKIFAIILIIISILAIILVGKAIYSGKKNINKIVDQFSFKYKRTAAASIQASGIGTAKFLELFLHERKRKPTGISVCKGSHDIIFSRFFHTNGCPRIIFAMQTICSRNRLTVL